MTACLKVTLAVIWIYPKYCLAANNILYTLPSTEGFRITLGHYTVQNLLIISPGENIIVVVDYVRITDPRF